MSQEEQDAIQRFIEQGGQPTKLPAIPPKPKRIKARSSRWHKGKALKPGGRLS